MKKNKINWNDEEEVKRYKRDYMRNYYQKNIEKIKKSRIEPSKRWYKKYKNKIKEKRYGYSKNITCQDCNKLIHNKSIRCVSCNSKKLMKEGKIINPFKGKFGKDSPSYIHGKGHDPYDERFNYLFKKTILERDNYTCQLCHTHKEYLDLAKILLEVHHINGDRKNSIPQNCISLCRKCHVLTRTKGQIQYWIKFFQSMLFDIYKYKYTEDQKIILNFTKENLKKEEFYA